MQARSPLPVGLLLVLAIHGCGDGQGDDTDPTGTDDTDPLDTEDDDSDGYSEAEGDCDDGQPAINPMATDIVGDEIDQNCDGADGFDGDGDGHASYASGGDDCDDEDNFTFPGAIEIWYDSKAQGCEVVGPDEPWNDYDQDGDGEEADFWEVDGTYGTDCDDRNADIHYDAQEVNGNGVDENCNGIVDGFIYTWGWTPTDSVVFMFSVGDVNEDVGGSVLLIPIDWDMNTNPDEYESYSMDYDAANHTSLFEVLSTDTAYTNERNTLTYAYWPYIWGYDPDKLLPLCATYGITCIEQDPATL